MTTADSPNGRRLTARGAKTRARIVTAAADPMYIQGVGVTTLDDVVAAGSAATSGSGRRGWFDREGCW